ncbi:Nucleotide-binding alpha-beta plait domain containing protein [Parasponia andersonii]|uniref:Nucleotide-binding alpha-beta plait domain containing protein n=1 Tax=Parasponia andersonii TaxID=3476 RepID=A0A2P5CW96_PARAD|nr:Nucleotide-binding alpha-beta plait domain containing protein [Parasponia andersonii]
MSSPYQILDNRPIDQWKVTELKEELKKRKLTTRGLKEDLVKRLDEAVRIERENTQDDADNGLQSSLHPAVVVKSGEAQEVLSENLRAIVDDSGTNSGKGDNHPVHVDSNNSAASFDQGNIQEGYVLVGEDSTVVEETLVVHATTVDASITVTESVVSDVTLTDQDLPNSEVQEENEASKPQLENEDSKSQLENEDAKPQLDGEHIKLQVESDDSKPQVESDNLKPQLEIDYSKSQLENEYSKPTSEEVMLDVSAPENQVSEVRPNLGSQTYDSISTDSVSINEKIELKDNIIADNVKLELDVIKPEMVAPSSSTIVPASGYSHPMDVEEPHESNTSVEEKDDTNGTNADLSKKNDSLDVGYSEKLNLDRSSGDDSMEEDVLESKQIDSKYSSDDVGYRSEKNEISDRKEEGHVDVVGDDFSADGKDVHVENKECPSAPAEKRKLNDESLVGNSEPVKRQRRWNSASLKVPEPQSSNITATTPKDSFQSPASKGFARVDLVTNEDSPKERAVPPSPKPPTTSLRIDRFLRPFTLKAVQELLGKTGNVTSFWMDHIKTHCYVTYSSVEEAIETRNAVYNLQWPPNGGRLLVAEFVDPREVKTRLETPQAPVASANAAPIVSPTPSVTQPQQPALQLRQQQLVAPPPLPPPPPLTNPPQARERLPLPPPPPLPEKLDPPIVTLDDLFRKTKATPRIYYLPLSEEQVNTKLAAQGKSVKQ